MFDVGFAIDGSGSIDNNEYRLTKDFVLDIIGIFSVSDEGTHVALLEYASEAPIKIYFDDNYELLNEVKGLKQSKGHTTNIGTGLKQSLVMFDVNNGMRQEVRSFFFPTKISLLSLLLKNLQHENRLIPCLDLYMLSGEVCPSSFSTRAAKTTTEVVWYL